MQYQWIRLKKGITLEWDAPACSRSDKKGGVVSLGVGNEICVHPEIADSLIEAGVVEPTKFRTVPPYHREGYEAL